MSTGDFPVLEMAVLDVTPGQAGAFKAAFAQARPIIEAASGFGRIELRACVENDHRFLLLVWWDSVESHMVTFRGSPDYEAWRRLLHHFFEPPPVVQHYVAT